MTLQPVIRFFSPIFQTTAIGFFRILVLMFVFTVFSMIAMPLMHEYMHQWTQQNNQKWKIWKDVGTVINENKIERHSNKYKSCHTMKAGPKTGFACHLVSPMPPYRQRC